ncbi:MAG: glycosyltransferase family 4 protein [Candidatus Sulfotelmatobacter sp.]|jgi:glycosyltransferase involved in cell wall biosynthesis
MKILWVKAGKLWPIDTGGKIRSFNILRHLAKHHDVALLSYYGGRRDPDYETAIVERLPGTTTISTGAPEGALGARVDYISRLASNAPYAVAKFAHPAVKRTVTQWLTEKRFDVTVCDFLSASLNFPPSLPLPCLLFQHNVETILWQRMAETETSPFRRLAYHIEAAKMARYEKNALRRFHHIIAVSQRDRDEMLQMDPRCRITVVPTGVDTEEYRVAPSASADPPLVVFTGSMDWEPNIDAVDYFCREIWPSILHTFPNARFQIVGRNPHSRVHRLEGPSVEVTGLVPSVTDFLRSAAVVVVPLRIGGGTRLKIFEAMAMGKAVVSTSIGAEGLDVTPGRDLLIADTPESFASGLIDLLQDRVRRQTYEEAAAALAARYDWSQITAAFAAVLQNTIDNFYRA